jgi:DNA primase
MSQIVSEPYFNQRIHKELGLTEPDYTVSLENDAGQTFLHKVFGQDKHGNITMTPFTLDGELIRFDHPKATPEKPNSYNSKEQVYRVTRYAKPIKTADGEELRYVIPKGQGTGPFLTPALYMKYHNGEKIKTLFLTEGAFKQYTAAKYGLDIIGLTSITHYKDKKTGKLHSDILRIIKKCKVENVVMIYDGDCMDISEKAISKREDISYRPQSFINSAIAIRELLKDFDVQYYFCHIKSKELTGNPKGLDDLIIQFKGKETEIIEDIKNFSQQSVYFYRLDITRSYKKLLDYFNINNLHKFYEAHIEHIKEVEFNFRGKYYQWSSEQEKLIQKVYLNDVPIVFNESLQFWGETDKGKLYFDYHKAYKFLEANNFGRYVKVNGDYIFIQIIGKIVKEVQPYQIKDFIQQFLEEKGEYVILNMIFRGGIRYLGPASLGNLPIKTLNFPDGGKGFQCLFFKNEVWHISNSEIKSIPYSDFPGYVWADQVIDFDPKLNTNIFNISEDEETNEVKIAIDPNHNSHFLHYLINTSKIYWKSEANGSLSNEQLREHELHLLSKLQALGYLLHSFRDDSQAYAVIGMDSKESDVGDSNGGTGKSLYGQALNQIISYVYLSGKSRKMTEDQFIWQNVTEQTKFIFIDDVRISFDFEFLYPVITGEMTVNPKGTASFNLPKDKTPKIYISTNHAIKTNGDSDKRRQWKIGFSDYYHSNRSPVSEFGSIFFSAEWPEEQWNDLYSIMALSIQGYLRFGKIEAPGLNIVQRELRQFMGEDFLLWAEEYFSDSSNRNIEIPRKDMYNDFQLNNNPKYTKTSSFKKKIKTYCAYKGLLFNPSQDGGDHKTNGVEYFTIGDAS